MTPKEATDKNIITKQVVINTPTSARLLPITADEKVIDEIQQSLTELEELKEMFKLQSYHFVVEIKPTSYEKAKIYSEYQNEIKRYKELFYKLKGKC
jgi:hypothetical protein